ncbi:MAG TPA: NAD(P)/FAD-dependent oxidoreductase [Gemmatimonadaceae bacterium]|nr:NAD(P)/FAD-dependent oxidoreductase [Gemmatimonadaceae bacterium]
MTETAALEVRAADTGIRFPRVLIIGAGFGGLYAARVFRDTLTSVTVVDRSNHHTFQPLLYQVATAVLAPSDIAAPIRWLLRKQRNTEVLMGDVERVDPDRKVAILTNGTELPYDYLILAAGARHSYFSHPEWEAVAPGLKSIDDAIEIRRRFLKAFEDAERESDPAVREALLTFVIIGGGPTGVELAGMLPTIARHTLRGDFRRIDTASARVILLEGGPRILPTFPEDLAAHAERDLRELGVDVRTRCMVTSVEPNAVCVGDERIVARTVLWAAGNMASPLGRLLGPNVPVDRAGRVIVDPDLSVPAHPEIFVVGDLAVMSTDGKPVPGVAQGAIQSGRAAARNVLHSIRGEGRADFRYWNKGDMATIGRYKAIGDFGHGIHVAGHPAWWFWLFLHILYLAGFRNRLSVLLEWGYAFFRYGLGARLITGKR